MTKKKLKSTLKPTDPVPEHLQVVPPSFDTVHHVGTYVSPNTNKYAKLKGGHYNFKGPSAKDRLALVMMIKNEEKRIEVSFDSVRSCCGTFVILDTGSTDRTIEIVKSYCKRHNIVLHLKEIPFVNFEKSRNDLLDFADDVLTHHHFMLLLDCNDELRNHDELMRFSESYKGEATGFYLRQQWWTGHSLDNYFNARMVLSHFGWRYRGVVHEVIMRDPTGQMNRDSDIYKLENVILFQDRTKDDDKTAKRFKRDKELLYNEYLANPTDARTLFYLAQTCACLQQNQESYEYYLLRLKAVGFWEEIYQSYFRLGNACKTLGHPWEEALNWYLKAYSHSKRVEPLVAIAEYYKDNNYNGERKSDWHLAYMFIKEACSLTYPHDQNLFIDKQCYVYKRWHLMGIIAFYVDRIQEGIDACVRALQAEDNEIDLKNLTFYLNRKADIEERTKVGLEPTRRDDKMVLTLNNTEYFPDKDEGLSFGQIRTKEEVMKKVREYMLTKK